LQEIVAYAVTAENHARLTAQGVVSAQLKLIGDRPAGSTAMDSDIVRLSTAALEAHGFTPRHVYSSTDANIPMSRGIPAIKIGSGGSGGRGHSLDEWIDVDREPSVRGMAAGLTAILALAGVAD
jgi:tripeptide aminopeptidase